MRIPIASVAMLTVHHHVTHFDDHNNHYNTVLHSCPDILKLKYR